MSDKFISLDSLKEYNKQMKETYIEPLDKKIEGKATVITFNITESDLNNEKYFVKLNTNEDVSFSEIDWGDGTINNNLEHEYTAAKKYKCRIYDLKTIGYGMFKNYKTITDVIISDTVTSIGIEGFLGCGNLTSLIIGNNVTSLGNYALCGCSGLINIKLPDSVETIGQGCFASCNALKDITIPYNVSIINKVTFANCMKLKNIIIQGNVTIDAGAFDGCNAIENVYIPYSLMDIYKKRLPNYADKIKHQNQLSNTEVFKLLTPLLTTAFNTFNGGFKESGGTATINRPGLYFILQGENKDKTLTINYGANNTYTKTCNAWIILSSDDGIVTPIGINGGVNALTGMFVTPGTFQGWLKNAVGTYDENYSTSVTYDKQSVIWYLGNDSNTI
jgi:hypothetical protein